MTDAILVLEDGAVFRGTAFGARGETFGEVVFNTALSGSILISGTLASTIKLNKLSIKLADLRRVVYAV